MSVVFSCHARCQSRALRTVRVGIYLDEVEGEPVEFLEERAFAADESAADLSRTRTGAATFASEFQVGEVAVEDDLGGGQAQQRHGDRELVDDENIEAGFEKEECERKVHTSQRRKEDMEASFHHKICQHRVFRSGCKSRGADP